MDKVDVFRKASVASVVISVISVLISMASAAGQLATKKGDMSGSAEIGIAIAAGAIYLFHQIRNWARKKNIEKKHGFEYVEHINFQVKHVENGMFKEYMFMRSFVIHFTNGELTEARLPLVKMTIKHEVPGNRTVRKITDNYQGKPLPEMFHSMFKRLIFEGHCYISDREEIKHNTPLYEWMEVYDIGSMLFVEIRNSSSGRIVAILVMQWRIKDGINSKQIPQIKEDKKAIEDIYDTL
jgi:hypothetical protein